MFYEVREATLAKEKEVPCSRRYYRLFRIQEMLDDERLSRNPGMVINLLTLAAKETGGHFDGRADARRATAAGAAIVEAAKEGLTPAELAALEAQYVDALAIAAAKAGVVIEGELTPEEAWEQYPD